MIGTAAGRRVLASLVCGATAPVTVGNITAGLSTGVSGSGITLVAEGDNWAGLQLTMLASTNPQNISGSHLSLMAVQFPPHLQLENTWALTHVRQGGFARVSRCALAGRMTP